MTETIEGTADEVGTEVVPAVPAHQSGTLFRTDDPSEVIIRATAVADALKDILKKKGMIQRIGDKEYVKVEGWQLCGSMLGVVPVVEWTRELEDGWEARVAARTLDGREVGAAEAMCTKQERTWKSRDPYALRSMAQTRATSKALRGPLGFIVTLAGYEATPAEEMPRDAGPREPRRRDVQRIEPQSDVTPDDAGPPKEPPPEYAMRLASVARDAIDAGVLTKAEVLQALGDVGALIIDDSVTLSAETLAESVADELASRLADQVAAADVS